MSLKVVPFKSLGAVSYSAVLSKQTVTAIFAKNEIRAFYGSLCCYLTMCKARKPYLHSNSKLV